MNNLGMLASPERVQGVFRELCRTLQIHDKQDKDKLKSLIGEDGELRQQWVKLLTMRFEGPLRHLTKDEVYLAGGLKLVPSAEIQLVQEGLEDIAARTAREDEVEQALEDMRKYSSLVKSMAATFRAHTAVLDNNLPMPRSITSSIEQKMAALILRKELLGQQVSAIRDQAITTTDLGERLVTIEAVILKNNQAFQTAQYKVADQNPDATFSFHDHIIAKMKDLHHELDYDDDEKNSVANDARTFASQIIMTLTEQAKSLLDIMSIEASQSYDNNRDHKSEYSEAILQEHREIWGEVTSLWDEVIPVAHMAVESQFLNPLLRRLSMAIESQDVRNATITAYTSGVLRYMNSRLMSLAKRLQVLAYHHAGLQNTYFYTNAQNKNHPTWSIRHTNSHILNIPTESGKKKGTLTELMEHYMKVYASIPVDVTASDELLGATRHSALENYIRQRARHGDKLFEDLHHLFETAVKAALVDSELGGELLYNALTSDSEVGLALHGGVHKDMQLEGSVAVLKKHIEQTRQVFETLRLDGPAAAPEFVVYAYKKASDVLAYKNGKGCFKHGSENQVTCPTCTQCQHFTALVRKWGDHSN
ncbi:Uu.00g000020.m01.CDS01 [Anthostomella pinea]|uniref:Uu.00g000020.m01.CDS01 n=1 Tax=Anthostomella pinea TaxID=933095 RepID=A0AAI8VDT7_9PEZI|nr:Uu.00g000020.m01.CDS01 [Anthostomella pinea]